MKLKHLLKYFNGYFTVYQYVLGSDIDVAIATHETPEREMKKLLNRKVSHFTEGDFSIDIYLK